MRGEVYTVTAQIAGFACLQIAAAVRRDICGRPTQHNTDFSSGSRSRDNLRIVCPRPGATIASARSAPDDGSEQSAGTRSSDLLGALVSPDASNASGLGCLLEGSSLTQPEGRGVPRQSCGVTGVGVGRRHDGDALDRSNPFEFTGNPQSSHELGIPVEDNTSSWPIHAKEVGSVGIGAVRRLPTVDAARDARRLGEGHRTICE